MLKVLHVHSGNLFGGVERVLVSMAAVSPASCGLKHEFALCFAGAVAEQLEGKAAPVHWLGEVRTRKPWTVVAARRRLSSLLRRGGFDTVIAHSAWSQAIFGGAVRRSGVPQIFWVHDLIDTRDWLQRWARRNRPDFVLPASHFLAAAVPSLFPGTPCQVVYSPLDHEPDVDPGTRERIREALAVAPGEIVIIQVGRLEPWKGNQLLLEALGDLRDLPGWRCWQVGGAQRSEEARYLKQLEGLAEQLGIGDRVEFLGYRSDVSQLLAAADIFCQPNLAPEPFGLTFVEAMHAGLPVVTSAFGGGAEVVDGYGSLVEPGNRTELAEALRRLILDPRAGVSSAPERRARAQELTDPIRQSKALAGIIRKVVQGTRTIE